MIRYTLLAFIFFGSFATFAEDKFESNETSNPILIDVRTDSEWNEGYIETAIHIPLDRIMEEIESLMVNKDQMIYLYCRTGNRSGEAEKALQRLGYTNAKNIGGIIEASSSLKLKITNE